MVPTRAVHIDGGPIEEGLGLLGPDLTSCLVDGVLEGIDVGLCKSSAEVASGGGIGDSACPESIEECFIVASEFDVLKACAVAERVVCDVENVVGLVVRQMDLEEVKSLVDGLRQTELMDEHVDGSDAAVSDRSVSVGHVIRDEAIGEDRPVGGGVLGLVESALDSRLVGAEPRAEDRLHSKSSVGSGGVGHAYFHKPRKPLRISSFLT